MDSKIIYHYTFGLTPKPVFKGAAEWRLDKRMFYGAYPSDHLEMPPACTAKSGFVIASMWNEAPEMACKCSPRRHAPPLSHRFVIASMWNEAAQHIEGWKTQRPAPPDAGKVGRLAEEL